MHTRTAECLKIRVRQDMGGCMSSPEADKPAGKAPASGRAGSASAGGAAGAAAAAKSKVPDFGLADQWEVIKLLGTGGEGETWLCREKATNREVAIKLVRRPIPKSITQIIQREIRILADLGDGHLNIVHAEEVVLSRTHVGLVMEFVKGEPS
ncbi:protein kinase [Monoraphidium neglectum]|uniref:Protein kinase n=1 Tax=Monoraphidium neglectum TaxID=145388 RepID=A0A0D2M095_9CHLO|nr:protein kinase [Monoraphidium neglectum]KIY94966.1 protein kinase [Monoraphidium neglectum]|eukprot:XP_013893986.1 protein kinase [Monoraphidium neglectum]